MFILMVIVFVLGYAAIALEHPLRVDKAASALLIGVLTWVIYMLGSADILMMVDSTGQFISSAWGDLVGSNPEIGHLVKESIENKQVSEALQDEMAHFISHKEILHHLGEISEILFFLLGAMTIVEIIDQHQGFKIITDRIKTTNKVKLLWILSVMTFFMSAALDNLTTTIVLVALLRKLIEDKETRWFYASMVILAANAGGAWSPIGDVTTIMLWIGGQVTAANIIVMVIIPSLVTMVVPLTILSFMMKGDVSRPEVASDSGSSVSSRQAMGILIMGVSALLFVPVFKTYTHLPPFMGMLFGLGVLWTTTEILHRWHDPRKYMGSNAGNAEKDEFEASTKKLTVISILSKVDVPTILFFLGILSAVASLQSAGQLGLMANYLDEKLGNIYTINLAIGVLSSIVDNVPLVAGSMGMYDIQTPETLALITNPADLAYASSFVVDGPFWEFLAYCAGTGGSILIIGSAAGVAAMGMEKIDFIWYMKKISLLALVGYLAGAAAFYLQATLLGHV